MTYPEGNVTDNSPVPVAIGGKVKVTVEEEYEIITSGFTYSRPAGSKAEQLLPEDANRVCAYIQCDAIIFIGTKNQMASINGNVPNAGNSGPGGRILNVSPFLPLHGINELWVAYTAATEVGVIVERRVPRGK